MRELLVDECSRTADPSRRAEIDVTQSCSRHTAGQPRRMVVALVAIVFLAVLSCAGVSRADATDEFIQQQLGPHAADANADLQAAQAAEARQDYATELKLVRPLAEQGNAVAQDALGVMYYKGQGVPKDYEEAVLWFVKAAEQGNAPAQRHAGVMYAFGAGTARDYPAAVRWLRKAGEQGDVLAQRILGFMYTAGQGVSRSDAEAVRWLGMAAEQGDASAQAALGGRYANGQGVPRNDAEAVHWFRKAAEQGYAKAQAALGLMYQLGRGVPRNDAEAFRWIHMAAEQGDSVAQGALGYIYQVGQGVQKNYVQAYIWYNLAAAGGMNGVAQERDRLEHFLTAKQIADAQQQTAAWRPIRPLQRPPAAVQDSSPRQLGTGFFIGQEGVILTNAHVVEGCSEASTGPSGRKAAARVIARDAENDLALLRTEVRPVVVAALRLSIRQGEAVVAYGYPLPGLLASSGNLTTGNVTALSGISDDSRLLQFSAPVQPGNSGGPLLDGSGNVVGVVEAKLNALRVASAIGDVPQNVNFAIKAAIVANFLRSNGIHYTTVDLRASRSPADIAEVAKRFTVPVECGATAP